MKIAPAALAALWLASHGPANAALAADCTGTESIAKSLQTAVTLHRSLVSSIGDDRQAYTAARKTLEDYLESDAIACFEAATAILSVTSDDCLADNAIEFSVEMDDVADERISLALGRLFLANPGVLERAIGALGGAQQKVAVERVRLGWSYVSSAEIIGAEVAADRATRLERMKN